MAVAGAELVADELAVVGQPGAHAGLAGKPHRVPLDVQMQAAALLLSSDEAPTRTAPAARASQLVRSLLVASIIRGAIERVSDAS